ncbi:hypothetical protein GCM10009627_32560 [Curtobacterium herbarum]|uniref:Uncharacterized protein n=1 Tax=Curtobacterium herbarum TaxID=150122 RepID=A0ABP4K777_9MICO
MVTLVPLELQPGRDALEHRRTRAQLASLLETRVVVDAEAAQHGHLFTPETRDTADAAAGQPEPLRGEAPTDGAEVGGEAAVVIGRGHTSTVGAERGASLALAHPGTMRPGSGSAPAPGWWT